MDIVKVYPLDAVYDSPEDVPEDVMFLYYDLYPYIISRWIDDDTQFLS
jgi:hypothetical protein